MNIARLVNQAHGGPVLAAWDVDQLDEAWLYAFIGLADLPRRQAPQRAINRKFEEFRNSHPTFGKRH